MRAPINFPDATMEFSFFCCKWQECFRFSAFPSSNFSAFRFFIFSRKIFHSTWDIDAFFENPESKYFSLFRNTFSHLQIGILLPQLSLFNSLVGYATLGSASKPWMKLSICGSGASGVFIHENACAWSLFRFIRPEHWNILSSSLWCSAYASATVENRHKTDLIRPKIMSEQQRKLESNSR